MLENDFAVTGRWGYLGQSDAVMPGQGHTNERPYTSDERAVLRECLSTVGESTFDIYLNADAFWRNVPANVWNYRLGGYQVLKKWLSYRERNILDRNLKLDEVQHFSDMARRIFTIITAHH